MLPDKCDQKIIINSTVHTPDQDRLCIRNTHRRIDGSLRDR